MKIEGVVTAMISEYLFKYASNYGNQLFVKPSAQVMMRKV